jgi:predicted PurR-regulated permease PerM
VSEDGGRDADDRDARRLPPWFPRALLLWMLSVAVLFVSYRLFLWLRPLLLLLLVAFFVALAMEPAVNALDRHGWRRGVATLVVFVGIAVLGLTFTVTVGGLLLTQLRDLLAAAPGYVEDLTELLDDRFGVQLSATALLERLQAGDDVTGRLVGDVAGSVFALAGTLIGFVFNLLTVLLFTFYLVADAPRLRRAIQRVLPVRHRATFVRAWGLAVDSAGGYLYSRALLAAASATFHGIALSLIGVPNALALGLWVGVISTLVPTVGTYLGGVLPVLVALAEHPVQAVWTLAAIVIYQQVENYLIAPPLTARTMALHPAVAFGAVIAGVLVIGPIGALLALPAAAMLTAAITTWGRLPALDEGEELAP